MRVFITGIAGMIGFHLSQYLVEQGHQVAGIDNFNDYYSVKLKQDRARLLQDQNIIISQEDIRSADYKKWFGEWRPDVVVHLAAYANPRHSMDHPNVYIDNNISGTQHLIDAAQQFGINRVIYASSSCVMHGQPLPWNEADLPAHQNNPYGWSKRVNECQFINSSIDQAVGLRFFTVYGPWGRPDMALFLFVDAIVNNRPMIIYNHGDMYRDFTYVSDVVQGIDCVLKHMHDSNQSIKDIYNVGYGNKVNLMDFVHEIESLLGRKAILDSREAHPADVPATWSDVRKLQKLGYCPQVDMQTGVAQFVRWYLDYYKIDLSL